MPLTSAGPAAGASAAAASAAADNVLAQEQASEAISLWLLGRHDAALQTLQKLESWTGAGEPSVAHNLALLEYYAGGCREDEKLLQALTVSRVLGLPIGTFCPTMLSTAAWRAQVHLYYAGLWSWEGGDPAGGGTKGSGC